MSPRATPRGDLPHLPVTRRGEAGLWVMVDETYVPYRGPVLGPAIDAGHPWIRSTTPRAHGAQVTVATELARRGGAALVQQLRIPELPLRAELSRGQFELTRRWTSTSPMVRPTPRTEAHAWAHVLGVMRGGHRQPVPPVPEDLDPTPVLDAIMGAWDALERPLRVDGVPAMPHLPMRIAGIAYLWTRGRLQPARGEQVFRAKLAGPPGHDRVRRTAARINRMLTLETWTEGGELWQRVNHRQLGREVLIHQGVCELVTADARGPGIHAPRRARRTRRVHRAAALVDHTVPWRLLLGEVLGEDAVETWLTLRAASGEDTRAPALAAALVGMLRR